MYHAVRWCTARVATRKRKRRCVSNSQRLVAAFSCLQIWCGATVTGIRPVARDLMHQRTPWLKPQYALLLCSLAASACGAWRSSTNHPPHLRASAQVAAVDDARLKQAAADEGNWLTHGRTYAEQRYSAAEADRRRQRQHSSASPGRTTWTPTRGQEATPLVDRRRDVRHHAPGARSTRSTPRPASCCGQYDPQVPGERGAQRLLRRREPRRRGLEGQGLSSARSTAA